MARGAPAFEAAVSILSQLLKAELAEREVRSIAYHMKAARFPAYKDLSGFDFTSSEINEATLRQLHKCEFMDGAQNVVLIGGPGTGKTHAATALGVQVISPFLTGCICRTYAAIFSFMAGVMPPMPMFGRSLLYVQSHCVA